MASPKRSGRLGRSSAIVKGATPRGIGRGLLALAGLALVIHLVRAAGPDRVAHVMWQTRALLPVIVALELVQLTSDFVSLLLLLGDRSARVPAATWVRSSAVAYAMMILVPAGRAAGEVARATMLAPCVGAPAAATASTELQSSYVFANGLLSAIGCAVVASVIGPRSPLALLLGANALLMFAFAGALIAVLWNVRTGRWLSGRLRRFAGTARDGRPALPAPLEPGARRRLPWRAAIVCSISRLTQVAQYGVVLHAVGGIASVRGAFVAHGIHMVGSTLGDMLPNQVGVVDGAYQTFAAAIGFGGVPARALSIALVARTAQLLLAGACVVVAAIIRQASSPGGGAAGQPPASDAISPGIMHRSHRSHRSHRAAGLLVWATLAACHAQKDQTPPSASPPSAAVVRSTASAAAPEASMAAEPSRAPDSGLTLLTFQPLALPGATPPVSLDYLAYDRANERVWVPVGDTGSADVLDIASGRFTRVDGFKTGEREVRARWARAPPRRETASST
jgi:hypothetical protein